MGLGNDAVRTLALVIVAFNITWGAAWSVFVLYALDHLDMGEPSGWAAHHRGRCRRADQHRRL